MKRIFLILVCLLWAHPSFADVTDNFNRADSATLGANWTQMFNTNIGITGNAAVAQSSGVDTSAFYSAVSWNNDQSSSVTIQSADEVLVGAGVRFVGTGGGSGVNGYYLLVNGGATVAQIQRYDNGVGTALNTMFLNTMPAPGDVFKLDVTGTTLTAFQNGVSMGSTTDSTYASGSPGVWMKIASGSPAIDSWTGTGEVGGGGMTSHTGLLLGVFK